MKIVLDTNILIAALISRGACTDLLEHCVLHHTIVSSDIILSELRRHLLGKFKYTEQEVAEALGLFESGMEIVSPVALEQPVCRDPDDDLVLGTAIAGNASCIITGDKDLLVVRKYRDVDILAPGDFSDFEELKDKE